MSIVRWVCQQTPTEGHRAFLSPVSVPRKTITVMDLIIIKSSLNISPHKSIIPSYGDFMVIFMGIFMMIYGNSMGGFMGIYSWNLVTKWSRVFSSDSAGFTGEAGKLWGLQHK